MVRTVGAGADTHATIHARQFWSEHDETPGPFQ
jgi:hypothetical protein